MESDLNRSVDRSYPPGMGLRPKACPRPRRETSSSTRDERPVKDKLTDVCNWFGVLILTFEGMAALAREYKRSQQWMHRANRPRVQALPWKIRARVNHPAGTGLSHGGTCSQWCPNVGRRAFCVEHPVIAPWASTLSDWQTTILHICVSTTTYMSCMVSKR